MSPNAAPSEASTPLIIPELVRLDALPGSSKKDVIEYLAQVVASAGRADTPEGLAGDAIAREETAPTGIPGGIAIPHCRSPHVLAPSLGFARLAEAVDFGAADEQAADLVFMIAAPAGADDVHLQLLAKLARGLMNTEFTDALRKATTEEEVARLVTEQVEPDPADGEQAAAEPAVADDASAPAEGGTVIVGVSSCPTGIAHTFMAAEALEQAGKERGVTVRIEGQGSGKIDWLDPALVKRADAVVFAHDLPIKGRDRFAGKPMVDVGVKAAVNDAGALVDQALAAMEDPNAARVPEGGDASDDAEEENVHWARRLQRSVMTGVSYMIPFVAAGGLLIALGFLLAGYDVASLYEKISISDYSLWNLPGSEFMHEIKDSSDTVVATETISVSRSGMLLYLGWALFLLGKAAMGFLVPALAGYIAFGLAGRPGIAPRIRHGHHRRRGGRRIHRRPGRRDPCRILRGLARRHECAPVAARVHARGGHSAGNHAGGRIPDVPASGQAAGRPHDVHAEWADLHVHQRFGRVPGHHLGAHDVLRPGRSGQQGRLPLRHGRLVG